MNKRTSYTHLIIHPVLYCLADPNFSLPFGNIESELIDTTTNARINVKSHTV